MVDYDLKKALARIYNLVETADNSNKDSMFDSLAEIALTSQNALADHSVTELLRSEEQRAQTYWACPYTNVLAV